MVVVVVGVPLAVGLDAIADIGGGGWLVDWFRVQAEQYERTTTKKTGKDDNLMIAPVCCL